MFQCIGAYNPEHKMGAPPAYKINIANNTYLAYKINTINNIFPCIKRICFRI